MRSPLHLDDRNHINTVVNQLRNIRETARITQADMGAELRINPQAVSAWERRPNPNPQVCTVQRYARAVNHRVDLVLHGIGGDPADPTLALLTRMATNPDPGKADAAARSLILNTLVVERTLRGLYRDQVGALMGVTGHSLRQVEIELDEPHMSTYMRYARALGGALTVALVPVVDVAVAA